MRTQVPAPVELYYTPPDFDYSKQGQGQGQGSSSTPLHHQGFLNWRPKSGFSLSLRTSNIDDKGGSGDSGMMGYYKDTEASAADKVRGGMAV